MASADHYSPPPSSLVAVPLGTRNYYGAMPKPRLSTFILIPFLAFSGPVLDAAEAESNARYLEELRRRGNTLEVEAICRRELARTDLKEDARASLTVVLMQTLADRAITEPPDLRAALFSEAEEAGRAFLESRSEHPKSVLIRLQAAINGALGGQVARLEAEAAGGARRSFESARDALRAAVRRFEDVHGDVEVLLRRRPPSSDFSRDELVNLEKSVRHKWAEALTELATCFPVESPDRVDLLGRASALLAPLSGGDERHPLTWQARIDRIRCERLLGHHDDATQALAALAAANPPEETALLAAAEAMRLALSTGRLDEAVALFERMPTLDAAHPKTLALAALDVSLEAKRHAMEAGDPAAARTWGGRVESLLREIARLYGPYWGRRAEMQAARYAGKVESNDTAMLMRAGALAVEEDRPDEAVSFYDRARAAAVAEGNTSGAFEAGYAAAAVEHRRERSAEAFGRFRDIALTATQNPLAPEAHLLAAWHAGRLLDRAGPEETQAETKFADILAEHLRFWPDASTADPVRHQLGLLHERAGRQREAIEVYQRISTGFSAYPEVLESIGRCITALAAKTPADAPRLASDAAAWFDNLVRGSDGQLPQRWSPSARAAAVEAARFYLETPEDASRAEPLLRAALADPEGAPSQWRSRAQALLIAALAVAGKREEALALTNAQLDAADPAGRAALERTQAELLAKTAGRAEALAAFETLVENHPRDAAVRRRYAELLAEGSDRACLEKSLVQWRVLAEGLKPDTPEWFGAKYQTAEMHYRLGNREQAARVVTVLRITRPELGGPEMKARFLELLQRCR